MKLDIDNNSQEINTFPIKKCGTFCEVAQELLDGGHEWQTVLKLSELLALELDEFSQETSFDDLVEELFS